MADQPGVMGPQNYPIRDPKSDALQNGRMLNHPRYPEFGGFDRSSKWHGNENTSAGSKKNVIALESGGPTGVKGAMKTSEKDI